MAIFFFFLIKKIIFDLCLGKNEGALDSHSQMKQNYKKGFGDVPKVMVSGDVFKGKKQFGISTFKDFLVNFVNLSQNLVSLNYYWRRLHNVVLSNVSK